MPLPRKICEGPADARIVLVGEAPGVTEDRDGLPFQGGAGQLMNTQLMRAGISRSSCFITNIAHERPPGNDFSAFLKPTPHRLLPFWLLELKQDIERIKPNVVVALGNWPMFMLAKKHGISKWRGSILESTLVPGVKIIPTIHPAAILRNWDFKVAADMDWKRIRYDLEFQELRLPEREHITSPSREQWPTLVRELCSAPWLSFDIECTPDGYLICCGFASSPNRSIVFDTSVPGSVGCIKAILASPASKIAQNGDFDIKFLAGQGIEVRNFKFDTMVAQHVCYPELPKGLDFLASIYTREPYYKDERKLVGREEKRAQTLVYNGKDATVTYECFEVLQKEIEHLGVQRTFELEMSLIRPLMGMTLRGVSIDIERKEQLKQAANARRVELEAKLNSAVGKSVNVLSAKQVAALLYGDLKLPIRRKRGAGGQTRVTTDEDALVALEAKTGNAVLRNIIDIREKRKLGSFLSLVVDSDGCIRSDFKCTADTGRLASSASIFGTGTNMQNIPEAVRDIFVARPGKVFVYADLSQAEARDVSWRCGDERMKELFRTRGIDIHRHVASRLFKKSADVTTEVERYLAKRLVHALNYGMAWQKLLEVVNKDAHKTGVRLTPAEAKALVRMYLEEFYLLPQWHGLVQEQLKSTRTLTNAFGRRRTFFSRWSEELFRKAYAFLPQSDVADRLNSSLVMIDQQVNFVELLVQVHDAVLYEVDEARLGDSVEAIRPLMEVPFSINADEITIPADFKWGYNWKPVEESNPRGLRKWAA